ncbi:MAG: citrate lyase acyl carrier protein [Tissierellia bacterium]|nr:citrate lyase acyl carrier protein [Tissierellia bacterium]
MKIAKIARAGSAESNDILIMISPADTIEIELDSVVKKQYGDDILRVIKETLKDLDVEGAKIVAEDKGALDFTIRARVKAAVLRGADI